MSQKPHHHTAVEHARHLAEERARRKTPRAVDVATEFERRMTRSDQAADAFARVVGSWRFIGIQSVVLGVWVALNVVAAVHHWDPYPFILLNLVLSFQAAYAAPIIMMSQNRVSELDRMMARADYAVNQHAELEVEEVLTLLHAQVAMLEEVRADLAARRFGPEG
jgi:uncharacterized membrane protein